MAASSYPHAARTTFTIARSLGSALARYGLPCCPLCHRENMQTRPPPKPACRTLDDLDLLDGWSG
jgi:hypothetical protein